MEDVRSKLISEINKIEDNSLLQQLTDLVLESDKKITAEFNESQISKIKESQSQIKSGFSIKHNELMKLIAK